MAKIRVYELAKELGKDNKDMETQIRGLGFEIKGVMSTLDDDQAELARVEAGRKLDLRTWDEYPVVKV